MQSVLIMRRQTSLERFHQLHGERTPIVGVDPSYLADLNRAHDEHYTCLDALKDNLRKQGLAWMETSLSEGWPQGRFDFVVAFGGDGTLITASYGIKDSTPLLGVRSSSASVGHLCAGDFRTVELIAQKMASGTLQFVQRARLWAKIKRADGSEEQSNLPALNDVLFAASSPALTSRYRLALGTNIETHKSSGVWVSTATGSSAAISAAGGLEMDAEDQRLQFVVRELYHKKEDGLELTSGFFRADEEPFWIENHCTSALLAIDGEKQVIQLGFGDRVSFKNAPPVLIAKPLA